MKKLFLIRNIAVILLFSMQVLYLPAQHLPAQQKTDSRKILQQDYDLVPKHSKDTQYYIMESKLMKHALDGTPNGLDIYRLYLRCVPISKTAVEKDEFTCLRFTVQVNDAPEVSIPSLANWKYIFSLSANGGDNKEPMFGIDHAKFEQLNDENGKALPIENTYHVYNAFIDFHTMSVFAEKPDTGKGIQDLKRIGQKIIHSASFSQPTVSLGSQVGEGSYFKNGEITLAFKGLSLVNKKPCAVLEYDSGESSFYLSVKPFPNMEIKTKGSSHYFGDINKDLSTGWLQKAALHELVISETVIPGQANKINSVIERSINIDNVGKMNF